MNRIKAGIATAAAGILAVATVMHAQSADVSKEFRYMMGTSVEVRAYGGDADTRARAIAEAFAAIAEVDRVMSNWRADSEITAANRDAAAEAVRLSDPLFSVIQAGQTVSDKSGGAFDMTVGPVSKLWGFRDHKPRIPSDAELAALRGIVGYRSVLLDPARRTMRFVRQGVEIDLGGIAKGFAVELAANVLRRYGLGGFIDAGGNQYLLGRPPGKTSWTVGVRDPDHPERLLATLELPEGSVSTSAQYANFFTVDGKRYGHIIDPRTLRPAGESLATTVFAADGTLADAASTAAFVLGPKGVLAFFDAFPGMMGVVVYRKPDGTIGLAVSDALRARFHPAATTD